MRISDWSSDVCSSDLADAARVGEAVMSVISAILIGLAMGLVFGFALEKSRVFEPGIILGQMQLRNFTMLKVFLSAVATGLVVLAALNGFGVVSLSPKATLYAADVVGRSDERRVGKECVSTCSSRG